MKITKLAEIAGVSVRTLHYYDEIGLLSPSRDIENKRREYSGNDFLKLHQILYYKHTGMPLMQIKAMMEDPHYDKVAAWKQQIANLELEKEKLTQQIQVMTNLLKTLDHDERITDQQYRSLFPAADNPAQQLAQYLWGSDIALAPSFLTSMPAEFQQDIAETMKDKINMLSNYSEYPVSDPIVQKQIHDFHLFLNQSQGNLYTLDVFAKLGVYYAENKQFKESLETIKPGFASFMRDAIEAYVYQKKGSDKLPE